MNTQVLSTQEERSNVAEMVRSAFACPFEPCADRPGLLSFVAFRRCSRSRGRRLRNEVTTSGADIGARASASAAGAGISSTLASLLADRSGLRASAAGPTTVVAGSARCVVVVDRNEGPMPAGPSRSHGSRVRNSETNATPCATTVAAAAPPTPHPAPQGGLKMRRGSRTVLTMAA